LLELVALLLGLQLCLFSSSHINAHPQKSHRFSVIVYLYTPACRDPAYIAVCENNPKLCLVILAIFDRILDCVADLIAIIYMPSGNEIFERDLSRRRQA
jgi:hypothetical protein